MLDYALSAQGNTFVVANGFAVIPSGAISAGLASRYGCDSPLAAAPIIATDLICLVTIPCAMMISG